MDQKPNDLAWLKISKYTVVDLRVHKQGMKLITLVDVRNTVCVHYGQMIASGYKNGEYNNLQISSSVE